MKIQVDDYLRNRRSFTKDEKQFLLDYVADRCVHCGVKLDIHSISVEHVFPLSKGGLNDILNLVPLCEKCNETKSNDIYTFDSYFNMMYFKSIEVAVAYGFYFDMVSLDNHLDGNIFPYDLNYIKYFPLPNGKNDRQLQMLNNLAKKPKKKFDFYKMLPQVILRKAFPADTDKIMALIDRSLDNPNCAFNNSYYRNHYEIHNAIRDTGTITYVIENSFGDFQGVIIFEELEQESIDYIKTVRAYKDVADILKGLEPKYVLTLCIITPTISGSEERIMATMVKYFLQLNYLPLYLENAGVVSVSVEQTVKLKHKGVDVKVQIDNSDALIEELGTDFAKLLKLSGMASHYNETMARDRETREIICKYRWDMTDKVYRCGDKIMTEEEMEQFKEDRNFQSDQSLIDLFQLLLDMYKRLDLVYSNDPKLYKKYGDLMAKFPGVRDMLKELKNVISTIYGVGFADAESYVNMLGSITKILIRL